MAILRGNFAVVLVAALPASADQATLETRIRETGEELGLDAVTVSAVSETDRQPSPGHVLTVYGADHPGIVHAVSAALAERGVNITDLEARLTASGESPIYTMVMELELPGSLDAEDLHGALAAVGSDAGVEVSLRELGAEAL